MLHHASRATLLRPLSSCLCSRPASTPSLSLLLHARFRRPYSESSAATSAPPPKQAPTKTDDAAIVYHGPLTATFRRLKIFSLSSLTLSFTLSPFMFIVESSLPLIARAALVATALGTSGISTALVAWCGRPYVTTLRRLKPADNDGAEGVELTTLTLALHPRITRVYDAQFLVETRRPFATWELAHAVTLPPPAERDPAHGAAGSEETVAETLDKDGGIIGRWIVKWEGDGVGMCREEGKVVRHFNIQEELLS